MRNRLPILYSPPWQPSVYCSKALISTSYNPLLLKLMTVQGNTLLPPQYALSLFEGDSTSLSLKLPSHSKWALCPSAMSKTKCSAFYHHRSMAKLRLSKRWRLSTKISLEFTKLGIPSQVFYIRFSDFHTQRLFISADTQVAHWIQRTLVACLAHWNTGAVIWCC